MQAVLIFLSKYWKQILAVIGGFIGWRYIRSFFNANHIKTTYSSIGATISKEQAIAYAERLYNSMKDFGTDEDELNSVRLMLTNSANLRLVYNEFGLRGYGSFGSPMFGSGTPTDLKGWIKNELGGDNYKIWEQMFLTAEII